jgi:poly-gamma-glutamate synthesis protein (capsule biosynthesis protein)
MIKLSFVGDIALNNGYNEIAQNEQNPFLQIIEQFNESDLIIGNLEVMCEGEKGENILKSPRLKASQNSLTLLEKLKVDIVTLGNNHVYDNLYDGFEKTINILNDFKINYLGAYPKNYDKSKYLIKTINNKKIGFLNYVHRSTTPSLPISAEIELNYYDKKIILEDIKNLKHYVDFIVLILHWGMDNSHFPEPWQRVHAEEFITAGADLIIGHHSHAIQGFEKNNNKYVFYSLGNFCFAPFHSNGELYDIDQKRNGNSIILHIEISDDNSYIVNMVPIINEKLTIKYGSAKTIIKIKRISKQIPIISTFWIFYKVYLNFFYKIFYFFWGNGRHPLQRLKKIDKRRIKRLFQLIKLSVI